MTGAGRSPRRSRPPRVRDVDRGSVTAELAVGLPAVVLVLVAVLLIAAAAVTQVRCTDAARAAARAAALGEDSAAVAAIVDDLAGEDARISVADDGAWVRVTVTAPVATGWLSGSLSARAEFAVPVEPDGS